MNQERENQDLLRDIRDLLAEREQAYHAYLAESKAEYEKYAQDAMKTRQMTGAQVGALSIWLFAVMFLAHLAAEFVVKSATIFSAVDLDVL
jgi:hypothetical protein